MGSVMSCSLAVLLQDEEFVDPPVGDVPDGVVICGAILLAILFVQGFGKLALEPAASPRWSSARDLGKSALLGLAFIALSWAVPLGLIRGMRIDDGLGRFAVVALGIGGFGALLGRVRWRPTARPAGFVCGVIAATFLAFFSVLWIVAVGVYYLGPGLH